MVGNTVELTDEGAPRAFDGPDPLLGRTLRHYEVVERIGQGGMSVVYRGRDHLLHRDVAIKVLHPFLAEKAECRHRLAREARAVARLEHDNILRIFDYSGDPPTLNERPAGARVEHDREGFLVTELVVGDTLKRFADAHTIWNVPELGAFVTWQLARALAHAHEQGVIHRDLKPENVMVRKDGVLKLMDFGIAQVVDSKSLTVTGTLLGSPAHMAPECIESFPADEQSDVFSLGTVLYWLTTGALPFEALTPHALLKAIVDGRYAPPQQKNPRVSDAITRVIVRSLATDRSARYTSAALMADDLRDLLVESGLTVSSPALESALADPEPALASLDVTVRSAALAHSTRLLDDDLPARALGVLSRVLASHPGDKEALSLLERAQAGADEASTLDDVPATEDDEDDVAAPALAAPPVDDGAGVRRALIFAGVATLLIGAAGVARFVDDRGPPPVVETAPVVADAPESDMSLGTPQEARARPSSSTSGDKGEARPILDAARPKDLRPLPVVTGRSSLPSPIPKVEAKDEPTVDEQALPEGKHAVATRTVEFRVYPPARVEIDGATAIDVFREARVDLAPGSHTLRFTNPAAVTLERTLDVPAEGAIAPVIVQLEPAPALVEVDTKGVDATVAIRPLQGGGGDKIIPAPHDGTRPIPVFFEKDDKGRFNGVLEYEVTATAKGKRPLTRVVKLSAGKTLRLSLVLEDAQHAEPPAAPSAQASP